MKKFLQALSVALCLIASQYASAQVSQVRYEVKYNATSCLYEAHAHVVGADLAVPGNTIPFPSQFSVVVPAAISDAAFTVVQSVNPPGVTWVQRNKITAPTADLFHDFHSFTMQGGGTPNAYPVFTVGTDILLFTFSVPHVGCEDGIRCFINGTDPNSSAMGMKGIDFTQSFKTIESGNRDGFERYLSNIGSDVTLPKPSASASNTFSCDGGTLNLFSTGTSNICSAHSSVSYSWSGPSFSSTQQNPAVSPYLVPGTYTVSVTDYNGCVGTAAVTLSVPYLIVSANTSVTNVSCKGLADGAATVSASGGTPGYTYLWSNTLTTATITGLISGSYTVTVTDTRSCTATATATITEPAGVLSASATHVDVLCKNGNNGSIDLTVTGGTEAYSYSWVASAGGVVPTGQANNQDLTGLGYGTYVVTVTDSHGCTTTASATLTEPAVSLSASTTKVDVLCKGDKTGSATATGHDGTPDYTYVWNTSPVQSTATATGLGYGTYVVTVTDSHGCTTTASTTLTEPAVSLSASTTKVDVLCKGDKTGSATATGKDGTPDYTYVWNT